LKNRALEAAAEGITIADARLPDNPLIYANPGFSRLTGYSVEESIGRNCRFLQGRDREQPELDRLRRALREKQACTVLLRNYRKDGSLFWNRLSITPVRDTAGNVTHFIGVQSDVTEEKTARDALERANRELETANRHLKLDLEAAAAVQRAFLPSAPPRLAGVNFASMFRPCAELAGDMFNMIRVGEQQAALYMLDVSGHGAAAALLSVVVSRLLSEMATAGDDAAAATRPAEPREILAGLNRQLPTLAATSQYFTIVYAILDAGTLGLRYASAGHYGPLHLPRAGPPAAMPSTGIPAGLFPSAAYEEVSLQLGRGDRVYFYTDGILEATNPAGEEFGDRRFMEALDRCRRETLETGLRTLLEELARWRGSPALADDLSLLALEIV